MKKIIAVLLTFLLTISFFILVAVTILKNHFDYMDLLDTYTKQEYNNVNLSYVKGIVEEKYLDIVKYYTDRMNDYLSGKSKTLNIDRSMLLDDVNEIITYYEARTNTKINRKEMEPTVDKALKKITEEVEKYRSNSWNRSLLSLLLNQEIYYFLILFNFICFLSLFALLKISELFRYLSFPLIIDGSIFIAIGLVLKNKIDFLSFLSLWNTSLITGLILFSIGIVVFFIQDLVRLSSRKQAQIDKTPKK